MTLTLRRVIRTVWWLLATLWFAGVATAQVLPSWNDGSAKARIVAFVAAVTDESAKDYLPPNERIAVFDNDGTRWTERSLYVQRAFVLDRVKQLAPKHPEWKSKQPFKAVLEGFAETVAAQTPSDKPNILVIFGDDVGQTNISANSFGVMGYNTPKIESRRLHAAGPRSVIFEKGEPQDCLFG